MEGQGLDCCQLLCVYECVFIPCYIAEPLKVGWDCPSGEIGCIARSVGSRALDILQCAGETVLEYFVPEASVLLKAVCIAECFRDSEQCISGAAGGGGGPWALSSVNSQVSGLKLAFEIEAERVKVLSAPWDLLFGDPDVFAALGEPQPAAFTGFFVQWGSSAAMESDGGLTITASERQRILQRLGSDDTLPHSKLLRFLDRWNRTVDYWNRGWKEPGQVPDGFSLDFMSATAFHQASLAANAFIRAVEAGGYSSLDGPLTQAARALELAVNGKFVQESGVCARVKIQIDQRVAIARNAFKATLEIDNAPQNVDLTGVAVTLDTRGPDGQDASDAFQVRPPELTNISDINGGGTIASGSVASAVWTIVPTRDAAPTEDVEYTIGGTLMYRQGDQTITIPLLATPITVKPDPLLKLIYFLPKDVYSDDPFTPQIEPAEPFPLGLLVKNDGFGECLNMTVSSSQPRIVENDKGLLIDFAIIGSQVNNRQVSPSLDVNFGKIPALGSGVARWFMTTSLQGRFVDFTAKLKHIDGLGNPRLSLIDTVETNLLVHSVRIQDPDDGVPDFLGRPGFTIEGPLYEQAIPTRVWSSDGSVADVTACEGTAGGAVGPGAWETSLTCNPASGFCYIRADEPGFEKYKLARVVRSDGKAIMLDENAWTTHRTIRLVGQPVRREHKVHIFDRDSTGSYTLYYESFSSGAETIGELKLLPNGTAVKLGGNSGVPVTAQFADCFYVEAADRSSGIKVVGKSALEGTRVSIDGTMATGDNGERHIVASSVVQRTSGGVPPVSLTMRTLYGGGASSGDGQRGFEGGAGVNTIGLFVQLLGTVTEVGDGYAVIDDGSGPKTAKLEIPAGSSVLKVGDFIRVVGVVSCEKRGESLYPLIRIRRPSDIRNETSGPQIADLRVEDVTATSAVVKFNTDVVCQGFVHIGENPGDYTRTVDGAMFVNGHAIAVDELVSGKTYYYKVTARKVQDPYISESAEQSFKTLATLGIGEAKLLPNDDGVYVTNAIVTRLFGRFFYMEQADRAGGGLRVSWDGVVQPGDVVSVAGKLGTTSDAERQIVATSVVVTGHADTQSLWVNLDLLGGGPLQYNPTYGSGQRGVQVREWLPSSTVPGSLRYMTNVPNLGLLVTATGSLSSPAAGLYYLDHGGRYGDSTAPGVRLALPRGFVSPPMDAIVSVTGISSSYRSGIDVYRLLRVASQADVTWHNSGLLGAKRLPDNTLTYLLPLVVTATFDGYFYAQDETRSGGLRIVSSVAVSPGDRIRVVGAIKTNGESERYIEATDVSVVGSGLLAVPLIVSNASLGGGDWGFDSATGVGQRGVNGSFGLNNIGLLVRVVGQVTSVDAQARTFTVWDGSSWGWASPLTDSNGSSGVKVSAGTAPLPALGEWLGVTGISSCYTAGKDLYPLVLIRDSGDIESL